jgi:tripartite-type tricarboxylate transporter receptor subunit TctC
MLKFFGTTALVAAMVAAAAHPAHAQAEEAAFYKGKQVNLIIAAAVGGGYDLYARLVARHLGRHIPGAPNVVPQNMIGAGGNTGAGFIFNTAPKDGTAIGAATAGVVLDAILLDKARINHDPRKFKWLGSAASDSPCR